jgi:hypothetical protein
MSVESPSSTKKRGEAREAHGQSDDALHVVRGGDHLGQIRHPGKQTSAQDDAADRRDEKEPLRWAGGLALCIDVYDPMSFRL